MTFFSTEDIAFENIMKYGYYISFYQWKNKMFKKIKERKRKRKNRKDVILVFLFFISFYILTSHWFYSCFRNVNPLLGGTSKNVQPTSRA